MINKTTTTTTPKNKVKRGMYGPSWNKLVTKKMVAKVHRVEKLLGVKCADITSFDEITCFFTENLKEYEDARLAAYEAGQA